MDYVAVNNWSLAERENFFGVKSKDYPFTAIITPKNSPRPEDVSEEEYGRFVRIPFPEIESVYWLFTTKVDRDEFLKKYSI